MKYKKLRSLISLTTALTVALISPMSAFAEDTEYSEVCESENEYSFKAVLKMAFFAVKMRKICFDF